MDIKDVNKHREGFKKLSDAELHTQMHSWLEHSPMHVAAKIELEDRRHKKEKTRFHLVFWPSLIAAVVAIISLLVSLIAA